MTKERIRVDVPIPGPDGRTIVRTVKVEVEAEYDAALGDYLLDGDALAAIECVKAREIEGLFPERVRELRERQGMQR